MRRRDFLQLLAAAAAPAAAQVPNLERRGPPRKVVILGAGLAGLCSAYELGNQGHEVTVLEAQMRAGGRVRTLREGFGPGLYGEAGAESIPGAHNLTQHYARTLGLKLLPWRVPGMRGIYHLRGRRIIPDNQAVWPYELTDDERKLGMSGLSRQYFEQAAEQALAAGYAEHPVQAMRAWDPLTPGAWLRSKGASPGAAELLSLGFGTDFGSAASFLLHYLNSRGGAAPFQVEGGNDRLPHEFAVRVNVRYGAPVLSVTQSASGVEVVIRTVEGTETLAADRAICAIPCPVMGKIFQDARLPAAKLQAIREQSYSRTVKIFLQSRTRFWLRDGFSGHVTTDLPIERLTPDPGSDPAARGALTAYPIGPYTAALEAMNEEERAGAALSQARQIFPELSKTYEGGIAKCWGLDPWQRGSFALHTPGQIGFIETIGKPEGRIHFAGEHTSHWTGWMQGALDSARRVVDEVNR